MEAEEINGVLWECLAKTGTSLSSQELARKTGMSLADTQVGLARLKQAQLIDGIGTSPYQAYQAVLKFDALRWAKAVGLGVDLLSLELYASLSALEKARALKMTTDGTLEEIEEQERQAKLQKRDEVLRGRAASKVAATDLAKIQDDINRALGSFGEPRDTKDREAVSLLHQIKQETGKALDGLIQVMQKK
jgi:hypothetical protein